MMGEPEQCSGGAGRQEDAEEQGEAAATAGWPRRTADSWRDQVATANAPADITKRLRTLAGEMKSELDARVGCKQQETSASAPMRAVTSAPVKA